MDYVVCIYCLMNTFTSLVWKEYEQSNQQQNSYTRLYVRDVGGITYMCATYFLTVECLIVYMYKEPGEASRITLFHPYVVSHREPTEYISKTISPYTNYLCLKNVITPTSSCVFKYLMVVSV